MTRIYENLLPCLMLRSIFFNSIQKIEKIAAIERNENFVQSDFCFFYESLWSIFFISFIGLQGIAYKALSTTPRGLLILMEYSIATKNKVRKVHCIY